MSTSQSPSATTKPAIPRNKENDYTEVMAQQRRALVAEQCGQDLNHVSHYSINPAQTAGNIENLLVWLKYPSG